MLILAFYSLQLSCIFMHYLPIPIFHTFLYFDSFHNFAAPVRQLSQELLSEQYIFTLLNALRENHSLCRNSCSAFKNMYDFIMSISLVKNLRLCFQKLFEMKKLLCGGEKKSVLN